MKILVIRFSSLGDVILTTPVLRALKDLRPKSCVDVLTKAAYKDVFRGNHFVDNLIAWDPCRQSLFDLIRQIRKARYDMIIDLHDNIRSNIVRFTSGASRKLVWKKNTMARQLLVWFKLKSAGLDHSVIRRYMAVLDKFGTSGSLSNAASFKTETELYPGPDGSYLLAGLGLSSGDSDVLIGLAPGAKHDTKRWPANSFAHAGELLARAYGNKAKIIILGGKDDMAVATEVKTRISKDIQVHNLAGRTNLGELIGIISLLTIFISNDSGPMHIADALGIPMAAIFGPTVKEFGFAPYGKNSRIIEYELPCRPCSLHGTKNCPLGHHDCMNLMPPDQVIATAKSLMIDKNQ